MENSLPFEPSPKARANLRQGTIYAIDGGDSFIYYGQVASDKSIGFFKYRSSQISSVETITSSALMSRFSVNYQSIGMALRAGIWLTLGIYTLRNELSEQPLLVQWPVGTLDVNIWKDGSIIKSTKIHDPEIQNLEVIASYDAIYHAPERLRADYLSGVDSWTVGGPVWRERIMKEEMAKRHPEQSWHALLPDWVFVGRAI